MGNSSDDAQRFKGKNGNNGAAEVGSNCVDDCDHEHSDYSMALERREGHLLTEGL